MAKGEVVLVPGIYLGRFMEDGSFYISFDSLDFEEESDI